MKRKQPEPMPTPKATKSRKRRIGLETNSDDAQEMSPERDPVSGYQENTKEAAAAESTPKRSKTKEAALNGEVDDHSCTPTPKPNGVTLFHTPRKANSTPLRLKRADQSAKRKSVKSLLEHRDDDVWEGEDELAQEILNDGIDALDEGSGHEGVIESEAQYAREDGLFPAETPSKRGRGRPKGAKNKRSPTPEGDIPPEERYFFQNRSGPPQISSNTIASLKLLTHEEYFEQMRLHEEDHLPEKAYLMRLHARSFPQWLFELDQGFNICLYGWGSKRALCTKFAEWMHAKSRPKPAIVVVNGYTPKLNIRSVLATLASVIIGDAMPSRLVGQPYEIVDTILTHLSNNPHSAPILVVINSIDARPLRTKSTQHVLARIASHPSIQLVATADTPTLALLWNSSLLDQLKFLFHDCTTYAPYDAELNVVDDVHELLGRKGRRIGGKEGVGFVLKSLPENARNLYRVLLTEILSVLSDGYDANGDEDPDMQDGPSQRSGREAHDVGIEYRSLYQKASEEFICSSDMNFRFLLKEFHDHQMITSSRDASGTEILGVPLAKEEMEGVLEDLVLG